MKSSAIREKLSQLYNEIDVLKAAANEFRPCASDNSSTHMPTYLLKIYDEIDLKSRIIKCLLEYLYDTSWAEIRDELNE